MEAFDVMIPEIVRGTSDWVEDRYGRIAGLATFWELIVGVPVGGIALIVLFATDGK
jgi:hypothetical protein